MNLLSGSTWKGAKLRFGEAKPDFKERYIDFLYLCHIETHAMHMCISRIALENKAAAEGPPKKRRKRNAGSQAEDMTLVTLANVNDHEGWQVSSLGRITRPVKMRPERPLPDIQQEKPKPTKLENGIATGVQKKQKRVKDPDSRARRRIIDMTKWGSTPLKGMFLDIPTLGTKRFKLDDPTIESEDDEDDNDTLMVSQSSERNISLPLPPSVLPLDPTNSGNISPNNSTLSTSSIKPLLSVEETLPFPDNNTDLPVTKKGGQKIQDLYFLDLEVEKIQSLNLLASLFGDQEDNWVRPESVGSDIDVDELIKGDRMLVDDDNDGIEVVPIDNPDSEMEELQNEEEETREKGSFPAPVTSTKSNELGAQTSTKLKDLFAPREEEGNVLILL